MAGAGGVFTTHDLTPVLLVASAVLLVAVAAVRLSVRTGLPSLLLYLGLGLALGEAGWGIRFDNIQLTQVLGYAALILILSEGGLTTRWEGIAPAVAPAAVLSTLGVVVSVLVVGVAGHVVLGWSWQVAFLVGAVVSSTDAAAVFSVLRRVPIPRRVSGMLEAESGFNDAPVVILVTALASAAAESDHRLTWWVVVLQAIGELVGGSLIGLGIGALGGALMRRLAGGSSGLFSIGIVTLTVLAYGAAASVHASGFIATYLAGLVLGNMRLPHETAVHSFSTGLGWLAQIGLFVLLGLLASPSGFGRQLVPALVVGLVLLLLARPLSVVASLLPFRIPWREQAFLSWAGLRGAVPVVLATVPVTAGTPNLEWLFDLVFVLVVIFTLIQAPSLPFIAQRLGVQESHQAVDLLVESAPLDDMHATLISVDIGPTSMLGGVRVFELRLPPGANVTLIVRGEESLVPKADTVLRHGDRLLVVATAQTRTAAEKRLRAVSRNGRLAGWI